LPLPSPLRPQLDAALRKSRQDGIQYGICAEAMALNSDAEADSWLRPFRNTPVFFALLTKDGDWTRKLSQSAAQQFDYVLAAGQSDEPVELTVQRLDTEPIDIYAFAQKSTCQLDWRNFYAPGSLVAQNR
jgi:hypothetical protein